MDDIDIKQIPNCHAHPDRDSVDTCFRCENPYCSDCLVIFEGADLCRGCLKRRQGELEAEQTSVRRQLADKTGELERAERMGATISAETMNRLREERTLLERRNVQLQQLLDKLANL